MQFCKYCQRDVHPVKEWSWVGFIFGFGIIYLLYYLGKPPHCPICHADMGLCERDRSAPTRKQIKESHVLEVRDTRDIRAGQLDAWLKQFFFWK